MPFRTPSVRSRFVTRARYLKADRQFLRDVADIQAEWGRGYPRFAVGEPGLPPERSCFPNDLFYPPKLTEGLHHYNCFLRDHVTLSKADAELVSEASYMWRQLV